MILFLHCNLSENADKSYGFSAFKISIQ